VPRLLAIAAALTALALAGCGQSGSSAEDFEGEEQRVAEVVEDLQELSVDDDARSICRTLLAPQLQRAARPDCTRAVDEALKDADSYELDVTDVRITGTNARARVEAGRDGDQVETIELVRVGRDWKISRLAGR
jgi:outer membrane murein-binding lipoprotein Lpp